MNRDSPFNTSERTQSADGDVMKRLSGPNRLSPSSRLCKGGERDSPVFLFEFFVSFLLELGQELLQQVLGSIAVLQRRAFVGEVEGGAFSRVQHQLELDLRFAIRTDLLTCVFRAKERFLLGPGLKWAIVRLSARASLTSDVGVRVADGEAIFSFWTPGYALGHQIKRAILFPLPDLLHHQQHLLRQSCHDCVQERNKNNTGREIVRR